jgi:invasion protein IalB
MIYRNAWAPAALVNGTLGTIAKTAALTIAFAVASSSLTLAQQPPPKKPPTPAAPAPAKPAPQPQQAAPVQPAPQQQAAQQQQMPPLIYSPWTKFCLKNEKDPNASPKEVCFTGKDARIESGMPVVAAVVIEPEGDPKKILRVTLPLGMLLVHGTRVIIDQNPPMTSPFVICFANGCMADYEVNPEMIGKMKKAQGMYVQAFNATGQPISVPLPLNDFAKAYDGPPTDPKVLEAEQQKLQDQLQKRAEDARKKLEQGQPGATPGKTQ